MGCIFCTEINSVLLSKLMLGFVFQSIYGFYKCEESKGHKLWYTHIICKSTVNSTPGPEHSNYDIKLIPICTPGKDVAILAINTVNRGSGTVGTTDLV